MSCLLNVCLTQLEEGLANKFDANYAAFASNFTVLQIRAYQPQLPKTNFKNKAQKANVSTSTFLLHYYYFPTPQTSTLAQLRQNFMSTLVLDKEIAFLVRIVVRLLQLQLLLYQLCSLLNERLLLNNKVR